MQKGFYKGIFHNDDDRYIDEVKVTGQVEVFEYDFNHVEEIYRMGDIYPYKITDFKEVMYLPLPTVTEKVLLPTKLPLDFCVQPCVYWAQVVLEEIWEPVYIVRSQGHSGFHRIGIEGFCYIGHVLYLGDKIM